MRKRVLLDVSEEEDGKSAKKRLKGDCSCGRCGERAFEKAQVSQKESNDEEALTYFLEASQLGHKNAAKAIASMFERRGDKEEATEWFKKAAKDDEDPEAQFRTGMHYFDKKDMFSAMEWFTSAADQRYLPAVRKMIELLASKKQSFPYSKIAAELGDLTSQQLLAWAYETGILVEKNMKEAGKWHEAAAQQGDLASQLKTAEFALDHKDMKRAVYWTQKAADQKCAQAMCQLGVFYARGAHIARDPDKARELFKTSAEQGWSASEFELALLDEEQNKPKAAFNRYFKLAKTNNLRAQSALARCYMWGIGTKVSRKRAFEWSFKSLEEATGQSNFLYGWCCERGYGMKSDNWAEAMRQYKLAADKNHASGYFRLGVNLQKAKSWQTAFANFLAASKLDHADACYSLGRCYETGSGTSKNMEEAISVYRKGCALQSKNAKRALDRLGVPYETNNKTECVICLGAEVSHAIHPCGHFCLCGACVDRLGTEKVLCPVCRAPVAAFLKILAVN